MTPFKRNYILLVFSLMTIIPLIQMGFKPITPVPLTGAFNSVKAPHFSIHSFRAKTYQDSLTNYIKHEFPFRSDLVRLYNQLNYSLFDRVNTLLTVGKNDYLFDQNSIRAANGLDFIASPNKTLEETRVVKIYLNDQQIPLLTLIAPNKALFHQNKLPTALIPTTQTNYQFTINTYKTLQIPFIDAEPILEDMESDYPLLPKQAAHWSIYGASIVLDTLINEINLLVPESKIQSKTFQVDTSNTAKFTDNDYIKMLNLMSAPQTESFLYPRIGFKADKKIKALIIGDSFFWSFYDLEFVNKVFDPASRFIYYNTTHYNMLRDEIQPIKITPQLLKEFELIILCFGHENLANWNFDFFKNIKNQITSS